MKRKPIESTLRGIKIYCNDADYEFAHVDTVPYKDFNEFILYRSAKKRFSCLRTVAEWKSFFLTVKAMEIGTRAFDYSNENSCWKLFCDCICGYKAGLWDITYLDDTSLSVKDKIAWIQSKNPCSGHVFNAKTWDKLSEKKRRQKMADEKQILPIVDYLNSVICFVPTSTDYSDNNSSFTESKVPESAEFSDENTNTEDEVQDFEDAYYGITDFNMDSFDDDELLF